MMAKDEDLNAKLLREAQASWNTEQKQRDSRLAESLARIEEQNRQRRTRIERQREFQANMDARKKLDAAAAKADKEQKRQAGIARAKAEKEAKAKAAKAAATKAQKAAKLAKLKNERLERIAQRKAAQQAKKSQRRR